MWSVGPTRFKENTNTDLLSSRAMKIRTFCAKVLNLPTMGSFQQAVHGPRIGFPYPVGSAHSPA